MNNYLTIIEEATEELSPFVKKRVKEIIELGAQERKLSTQDVEFYLSKFVDVKNDLKIYKKTNFEKNEPFAALYQLSLNSFCDLLEKQYFDKKNLDEKARNDNKNLISKFIDFENMNLTTCLCLISISWYWDPKYFIKSLEKFPDNKIEIINVITSTVHFWDVETNSIIADTVLSEPNHPLMIKKSDGVSVHNFVTIFYLAKKSEKLLNFAWAHESLVGLAFSWKTDDENQKIFNLLLNGKLSIKKLLPRSILDCEKTYSEIKEPLKKVITQWGSQNQAIHDFNWFFEITSKWEESQNDDEMMEIFNVLSEKVKYGHIFISDDLKEKIEKNRFWRIHKSRFGPN